MTKLLIINAIANHIFIGECKLKPWHKVSKAETTRHGAEWQEPLKKTWNPQNSQGNPKHSCRNKLWWLLRIDSSRTKLLHEGRIFCFESPGVSPMWGHFVSRSEWNNLQPTFSTGALEVSFSHFSRLILFHPSNFILFPSLGAVVLVVAIVQSTSAQSGFPLFFKVLFNRPGLVERIWIDDKRRRFLKASVLSYFVLFFQASLTKMCLVGAYQGLDPTDSLPSFCLGVGQFRRYYRKSRCRQTISGYESSVNPV